MSYSSNIYKKGVTLRWWTRTKATLINKPKILKKSNLFVKKLSLIAREKSNQVLLCKVRSVLTRWHNCFLLFIYIVLVKKFRCACFPCNDRETQRPCRCTTHFGREGLLIEARSLVWWFSRLLRGPTHMWWEALLVADGSWFQASN